MKSMVVSVCLLPLQVFLSLRRKASRSAAESTQHEGLSSDEEYDSVYDPSSIASLLTESNLQTSSC